MFVLLSEFYTTSPEWGILCRKDKVECCWAANIFLLFHMWTKSQSESCLPFSKQYWINLCFSTLRSNLCHNSEKKNPCSLCFLSWMSVYLEVEKYRRAANSVCGRTTASNTMLKVSFNRMPIVQIFHVKTKQTAWLLTTGCETKVRPTVIFSAISGINSCTGRKNTESIKSWRAWQCVSLFRSSCPSSLTCHK